MDSLTQLVLGASVACAVIHKAPGSKVKIAISGAILGTLPDLDILIDYGDALSNMVLHRSQSHALFFQLLISPLLAWFAAYFCKQQPYYWRWLAATALILISHSLIDYMTVYGTQLGLPFSNTPFATGSLFVIDPLFTLPLLLGMASYFDFKKAGFALNKSGLLLSGLYLIWSLLAQQYAISVTKQSLIKQNVRYNALLVSATPFNTLLWRAIVLTDEGYKEGFYSFFDSTKDIRFVSIKTDHSLKKAYAHLKPVQQLDWFTRGFYTVDKIDNSLILTDLRMGVEGRYNFKFALDIDHPHTITRLVSKKDKEKLLPWLWPRLKGEDIPSPYLNTNQ